MKYRKLGTSDLDVSVIGLGTMSWPFSDYGQIKPADAVVDKAAILRLVELALELGVNLFDTAEGYGLGFAEELLGEAVQSSGKRERLIICTKVGRFATSQSEPCNLKGPHVIARCEASLKRLRTDYIDLYLAHRPDPSTPIAETMAAMETLRRQGKIRHFGVSEFSPEQLSEALAHGPVVANQLAYSLVERRIDAALRPFCLEKQVGIMVYSPLAKGLLSGKYDMQHLPDDYRHNKYHFAPKTLPAFMKIADRCRELAKTLNVPASVLAMAWCLAQPGITTVLPGVKNPEQIIESAKAADLDIPSRMDI